MLLELEFGRRLLRRDELRTNGGDMPCPLFPGAVGDEVALEDDATAPLCDCWVDGRLVVLFSKAGFSRERFLELMIE